LTNAGMNQNIFTTIIVSFVQCVSMEKTHQSMCRTLSKAQSSFFENLMLDIFAQLASNLFNFDRGIK